MLVKLKWPKRRKNYRSHAVISINFFQNHKCSSANELEICNLTRSKDSSTDLWSVIENTKWFKEEDPRPDIKDWYVADNGSGDSIGIKTHEEVWISYHDSGFK